MEASASTSATHVEIEDEVHRRMMQLEAQILQDAVQASASREWGKASGQPTALCPICAVPRAAHEANKNGRVLWKWRATGDTQQNKREPALNVGLPDNRSIWPTWRGSHALRQSSPDD